MLIAVSHDRDEAPTFDLTLGLHLKRIELNSPIAVFLVNLMLLLKLNKTRSKVQYHGRVIT